MSNYNPQLRYRILTAILAVVFAVSGWIHLQPVLAQSLTRPTTVFTDSVGKISLTASLFGSDNRMVTNGEYQVRFGIYNKNRDVINPYPSNADQGSRLWEETQTVTVKNGLFRAFLGAKTPFPTTLNFENGDYYLGIRIGTDSEMVPRKRLGAVPSAINSQFLNGYPVGTKAKMIPLLGKGGSLTLKGGLTAAGNLDINGKKNDIAGTLNLSGNALTSGGLLTVTPASGFTLSSLGGPVILDATGQPITITGAATIWNTSTLDINNTGAITIGINGNAQDITFETQNFDVNSTGAVTIDGTNFTYTPSGTYTVIPGSTYTIDATGAVSIDSDASSTLSGAGVNLTSDGANAITLTYAATGGTFQLTDGTTRIEVADNGDVVVGDDGATTTLDGSLITLSGNTLIVGQITETVTDNITDALDIQQGTNNYINVNTTDGAEAISFGNTTTNPSFIFLGTGVTSFAGDLDMQNNLILNIGNAGTDFTASGGLNLAGNLDVNGTANDIAGTLNLSGNALTSSGLLTITPTSGLTVNSAGQPITINGSTFDLNNSGAITIGTDLSEQNITFETLNFDVNSTG
ncbi:MAG: hypothetical protein Q7S04_04980, partial [Candidatus Moranbacteria bacterium]|nr:hypothetical protein [Candidatus Moranbacteria bacterium]